jgi:type II secretory pathway pseudopilin PulG
MGWGKRALNNSGFTLMEAMIAGGLVVIVALAIFPGLASLQDKAKLSTFKTSCLAMVRAKLNEYASGNNYMTAASLGQVPTPFLYTKYRYQNVLAVCTYAPTVDAPGFRELIADNSVVGNTAADPSVANSHLAGFQLWVNLRRYNPRVLDANGQPTRDCPGVGMTSNYQFQRVGDAIEVTVTGVLRTTAAKGGSGKAYAGLTDLSSTVPNPQLSCSLSTLIYPKRTMFRYYMGGGDGRIRSYQPNVSTTGTVPPESVESHFRTLWSQDPTATGSLSSQSIANIRGFSVSPDNNMVYILKPSSITRYSNCTDGTKTMLAADGTTNVVFNGVPDCTLASATELTVNADINSMIDSMTVDFGDVSTATDDQIYALRNSGPNDTDRALLKYDLATTSFVPTTDYSLPPLPRIASIFLAPSFPRVTGGGAANAPVLYVTDNSCYLGPSTNPDDKTPFCVTVYNSEDANLTMNASDLPVQAENFSY